MAAFISMTNEEQIYISAVRYALGRMTYIVSITVDFMISKELSNQCRDIMMRDIQAAGVLHELGMLCDQEEWKRLYKHLQFVESEDKK